MIRRKGVLLLLLAGLSGACSDETPPLPMDPDTTDTQLPDTSVLLDVVAIGAVPERYTAEVAARGSYAYTSSWGSRAFGNTFGRGDAVKVWDISGSTPQLVDSLIISSASFTGDVQISEDGRLLVVATEFAGGSIVLFDLTDPAHPVQLSRFSTPSTAAGVHTVKLAHVAGRHYAFLSVDPGGGSPAQLVIADITDPADPQQVLVRAMGQPFVHDVFVRDGILFTANWNEGAVIWDIGGAGRGGSPANPVLISSVVTLGGQVHNLWWYHDASGEKRYLFVGEEGPGTVGASSNGDIHVVDVSNLDAPREVAFYHVTGAGTHNFSVDESRGILYAAYYNAGVRALNVRGDLEACSAAQKDQLGRCDLGLMNREIAHGAGGAGAYVWGVTRIGATLYASDMLRGLLKIDLDPLLDD